MDRKGERERRTAALRTLAAQGTLTSRAGGASPALREALDAFGGEQALLLAAHQRWQVHLLARLDQLMELGPADPHDVVRQAVDELSEAMPGVAALLTEHADDPVLARAQRRLADYVDRACPCGRGHAVVASPRHGRRVPRSCPLAASARAAVLGLCAAVRGRAEPRVSAVARPALPRP